MKKGSVTKITMLSTMVFFTTILYAQSKSDSVAIQTILLSEETAWNNGDAAAYSQQFAQNGTFTNILGMFFRGHDVFQERHDQIFKGVFNKTVLQQKVVSFQFVRPDVAIVETLSCVSGFPAGPPPGATLNAKGQLYTRLLQVFVKEANDWKISAYHNVDLKPGIPVPEAK